MNAYHIMHEWDNAAGIGPRTDEELDREIPGRLPAGTDYQTWKSLLEARDVRAIRQGMEIWDMPVAPLPAFEIDDAISTFERGMSVEESE
jgi:hypothetical protein